MISLFCQRCPDALEAFERLGLGKHECFEAQIIETALYSVMTWIERLAEEPAEVELVESIRSGLDEVIWGAKESSVPYQTTT